MTDIELTNLVKTKAEELAKAMSDAALVGLYVKVMMRVSTSKGDRPIIWYPCVEMHRPLSS